MATVHSLYRGYKRLHLNEASGISPFSPASLGPLLIWYNPAGGISNLSTGAAVTKWNNYTSAVTSTYLTQSTAASQPIITYAYFGGKPGVYFDGSNDYLETSVAGVTLTAPWTVTILYNASRITPTGQLITGTSAIWQWRVSTFLFAYANGPGYTSAEFVSPQYGVTKMLTCTYNGVTMTAYDSLTSLGNGSFAAYTWNRVGSQWAGEGTWFQGAMAEIVIYNFALSPTQLALLHDNYFKVKYSGDSSLV